MDEFLDGPLFWGGTIAAVLVALYLAGTWNLGEFKKRGMACTKSAPFVGSVGSFLSGKMSHAEFSAATYNANRGHRAVGFFNLLQPSVFVRDPEVIRLITVKDFDCFTNHMPFIEETFDKLFGRSVFSLRGDRWRSIRGTLSPAYSSGKIKGMFALVDTCGKQLADFLVFTSGAGTFPMEMKELFSRFTSDVMASTAFGIQCDSLNDPGNEFFKMAAEIVKIGVYRVALYFAFTTMPRIMMCLPLKFTPPRLEDFFCSTIKSTVETREREKIVRPDMIHLLMEARKGTLQGDEEGVRGSKKVVELSDDDMAAQAFSFFFAGFDTTTTHLSFLSYQLAVNPDVQATLQQEIDEVLAANDGVLSYDAVQKMKYMDTVISETLRMWPSFVDLDRECLRDYVVPATGSAPAIVFKKGDCVQIPAFAIHRDPEYWPEPDRFDPDRFSDGNKHKIKPCTFLAFGSGPRACIGYRFALMMTKIAMARVLSKVSFEVTEKTAIPIRLAKGSFTLGVDGGIWLRVKPRS